MFLVENPLAESLHFEYVSCTPEISWLCNTIIYQKANKLLDYVGLFFLLFLNACFFEKLKISYL